MRILPVLIVILSLGFYHTEAQVSGYGGKRFILKSDALAPMFKDGLDIELEFAATRKLTVSAGFLTLDKSYGEYFDVNYGAEYSGAGTIQSNNVYLQTRYYFLNSAYNAPRGGYAYAQVMQGWGKATGNGIIGYIETENPISGLDPTRGITGDYTLNNVKFNGWEIGFGNQTIINNILVIDYSIGLTNTISSAGEEHNTDAFGATALQYGTALLQINDLILEPQASGVRSWGINMGLKVGIIF